MVKITFVKFMFLLIFLSACTSPNISSDENKDTVVSFPMNHRYIANFNNDSLIKSKLEKALKNGDTLSYSSVSKDYALGGGNDEFMFHALNMADKFGYSEAYFDVYGYFDRLSSNKLYKKLADYYLIKSYLKGSKSAEISVKVTFGENIDSVRLKKYLEKLEKVLCGDSIEY